MLEPKNDNKRIQTTAVHAGEDENPSRGLSSPIFQSATYRFDRTNDIAEAMAAEAHPEFYGRYGSPNTKQVEATIAQLEGGEAALAVASGMAAVSLVMLSLLKAGDHIVAQRTIYPTSFNLLHRKISQLGIEVSFVEQTEPDSFLAAIQPNTRIIYVETPANPTLTLTDLRRIGAISKEHGILAVADNTFATPYNQRPLSHGFRVAIHSATKYLSGHSDVIAGAIVSDKELIGEMWQDHILFGAVLHPQEAWLLRRGLKTFGLRMKQHNENAEKTAQYLAQHPAIEQVFYPGLAGQPQYELARKQMPGGYGGMVSFILRGGLETTYRFLERLQLISLAVSLGGAHSLITHPASTVSSVQSEQEMVASGLQPGLVRLSVGLEDADDIIADLEYGLKMNY
jgi:methionine-gamma-lyase